MRKGKRQTFIACLLIVPKKQTIDTVSDDSDLCDFYKLWAAANAVETLCIIKGKAGMVVGNGVSLLPFVTLFFSFLVFCFSLPSLSLLASVILISDNFRYVWPSGRRTQ